jgi:membrane fusion protein, multidrug efflux system
MSKEDKQPPPAGNGAAGSQKRKQLMLRIGGVFVVIGIVYGLYWVLVARFYQTTDDAYVAGNVVTVTPQITATVTSIEADDTDLVKQGQPLVRLDDTDTGIALDQAKAHLAETVRQVRQMDENLGRLRANVTLREADVAKAKEDVARREKLVEQRAVSAEEMVHFRSALDTADAALRAARHELAAAEALVAGTSLRKHPLVRAAEAKLRQAYIDWERHVVLAPVTGYVARRSVQIGQRVAPGTPLMTVVPLNQVWVEANFKEDEFTGIRIGQPVSMIADLYGGSVTFHGTVLGVGAGTGAAFALLPPQNASGNWIKIVQRVPVRVSLDPKELAEHPLRVGLSIKASVDTHDRSGDILARTATNKVLYQTDVYAAQTASIGKIIDEILYSNSVTRIDPPAPKPKPKK